MDVRGRWENVCCLVVNQSGQKWLGRMERIEEGKLTKEPRGIYLGKVLKDESLKVLKNYF